jgi:tight adherence protein B
VSAPLALGALVLVAAGAVRALQRARWRSIVASWAPREEPAAGPGGVLPPLPPPVREALAAADLPLDPESTWRGWMVGLAVVSLVAGLLGGPGLMGVVVVVLTLAPAGVLWAARGRADRALEQAIPALLDEVARGLRSGAGLHQALAAAAAGPGPVAGDLAEVLAEVEAGRALVAALEDWAARRPLPGVRLTVGALALGLETGGAHARAIDGVAATVRARGAVAAEVRAMSSQARLSGLVIALAPIGFGAFAAATDPRTATFLFRTTPGLICLTLGLVLDGLAAAWMHRLAAVEP